VTIDDVMTAAPVIPVLVLDGSVDPAVLAETLVGAGLPALEVTLRTPQALDAIRAMAKVPGAIIGAGTVLNAIDMDKAIDAGAQPAGQWGDYHSAVLDARSPKIECGVTALYNYQMGIFLDREGRRFLDEGEDFRDHTYVKDCASGIQLVHSAPRLKESFLMASKDEEDLR